MAVMKTGWGTVEARVLGGGLQPCSVRGSIREGFSAILCGVWEYSAAREGVGGLWLFGDAGGSAVSLGAWPQCWRENYLGCN